MRYGEGVLLSPSETAERLHLTRGSLCQYRVLGIGPRFIHKQEGRYTRVYYPVEAVQEWDSERARKGRARLEKLAASRTERAAKVVEKPRKITNSEEKREAIRRNQRILREAEKSVAKKIARERRRRAGNGKK